jgi:thiol-disulfide isomerase/thioredoxin
MLDKQALAAKRKEASMKARLRVQSMVLLAVLALSAGWVGAQEQKANPDEAPAVIAVKFHADWCGFCKSMGSAFEELQAKFDVQPVLYITLDHTREFNRKQSAYLAQSLGLSEIWGENGNKTGFVLLIDGKSRKVITRLTHEQSLKEMGASLLEAVKKASAKP